MFSINDFNNYDVSEPFNNIFVIKNFITEDEENKLMNYIYSLSQSDWETEYNNSLKAFCLYKFGTDDVEKLVKEGKFEITENWSDKNMSLHADPEIDSLTNQIVIRIFNLLSNYSDYVPKGPGVIQRQQPGVSLTPHFDQHTDPSISHAAIIYLNDNYIDGELYFPNKDYKIKPKKISLVIFPGTQEYMHGVFPPGDGPIRYVLPGFIGKKDFYDNK